MLPSRAVTFGLWLGTVLVVVVLVFARVALSLADTSLEKGEIVNKLIVACRVDGSWSRHSSNYVLIPLLPACLALLGLSPASASG